MALLSMLGYRTVNLGEYAEALKDPAGDEKKGKRILLTFDDASFSVVENALPEMGKYGFKGCVFAVAGKLGGKCSWDGEADNSPHRLMNAQELRTLAKRGWDVGAHTMTHPDLTSMSPAQAWAQIADSKKTLEALLEEAVTSFAYPYGRYDSALKDAVRSAGYSLAFATEQGDGDPLALARRIISGRNGPVKFLFRLFQAAKLAGRRDRPK